MQVLLLNCFTLSFFLPRDYLLFVLALAEFILDLVSPEGPDYRDIHWVAFPILYLKSYILGLCE